MLRARGETCTCVTRRRDEDATGSKSGHADRSPKVRQRTALSKWSYRWRGRLRVLRWAKRRGSLGGHLYAPASGVRTVLVLPSATHICNALDDKATPSHQPTRIYSHSLSPTNITSNLSSLSVVLFSSSPARVVGLARSNHSQPTSFCIDPLISDHLRPCSIIPTRTACNAVDDATPSPSQRHYSRRISPRTWRSLRLFGTSYPSSISPLSSLIVTFSSLKKIQTTEREAA